jgi:hypothetical protein
MNNTANTDPEIIARRATFDGVAINLHADGSLSTRTHFIGRIKLPVTTMWREIDDVSIFTYAELSDFIRAAKAGERQKARDRADWINSGRCAAQVAANSRDRMNATQADTTAVKGGE